LGLYRVTALGILDRRQELVNIERGLNDPILAAASENFIPPLARMLSGGSARWTQDKRGLFYLQAVEAWELNRVSAQPNRLRLLPPSGLVNDLQLARLQSLWDGQGVPINPDQVANSVIFFIEEKYGVESVGKFLKALGPADAWAQVITNSLGVSERQFEQQWKDWLKQVYVQGF
jgi:hypothetical protein